jgi:TonB-linked SusC/RagA family outer membrane protein
MSAKSLLQAAVCALAILPFSWAEARQSAVITGTVSDERGRPLAGARVFIELTNSGATTNGDGEYRFSVPEKFVKGQEVRLTARLIGYLSQTEKIVLQPGVITRHFDLPEDALGIDAVITTGVLDETPKTKTTFSAAAISAEALERAPTISPETALCGKVAGLKVVKGNGQPGESASLLLRGPTSINASGRTQDPLYIVDGAILDPSISGSPLADILADAIESMEVVKGAAGASLYGARGANGVIRITTKRGQNLGSGQTRIIVRNEIGIGELAGKIKLNQRHGYKIADSTYLDNNGVQVTPGDFIDRNGNWLDPRLPQRQPDPYRDPTKVPHAANIVFYDKPYKYVATGARDNAVPPQLLTEPFDQINQFFDPGLFLSNTISISRNTDVTNFLISFGNRTEAGVVTGIDGLNRKNVRLILDHQLNPSLSFGVSGLYSFTKRDLVHPSDPFFALTFMAADADITARDENGQLFIQPDPTSVEDNPLYFVENNDRDDSRSRILGNLNLRWYPVDGLALEGDLSFDRSDRETELFWPVGYESVSLGPEFTGRLVISNVSDKALNGHAAISYGRQFGDLIFRAKAQGLFERADFKFTDADGRNFSVRGTRNLGYSAPDARFISSELRQIRSNGYSMITAFDFKDRYIGDLYFGREGSSLFGAEERWQTYYRTSLAYRISQEPWWLIPGVDEFKLRAAYGTAGSRPNFFARFQIATFKQNVGNPKLKPEFAQELEYGLDMAFLKRFTLDLTYAKSKVEDQILFAPLPAYYGYSNQWRNAGTLEDNNFEASLKASILEARDLHWRVGVNFGQTQQKIAKLEVPAYAQGPFFIKEGEELGAIYGGKFIKDLNDLPAGISREQFNVNDDGYVVWVGNGNTFRDGMAKDLWGLSTTLQDQYGINHAYRWGIPIKFQEAQFKSDGGFDGYNQYVKLGSTLPDFNLGFHSDLRWKGITISAVLEAQIGGDIYNNTRQWGLRDLRLGEADQFDKPDELKKPGLYYTTLYDVNSVNSHFVEDATHFKLRELAVAYTFNREALSGLFGGFLEKLSIGVAGRNLLTFTDYKGYDPEVGDTGFTLGSAVVGRFDGFGYPNFRTLTGVIEFEF